MYHSEKQEALPRLLPHLHHLPQLPQLLLQHINRLLKHPHQLLAYHQVMSNSSKWIACAA